MTDSEMKKLKPMDRVIPPKLQRLMKDHVQERQNIRKIAKQQITLRLDSVILDHFRSGGPGWQTRLNDALRGLIV